MVATVSARALISGLTSGRPIRPLRHKTPGGTDNDIWIIIDLTIKELKSGLHLGRMQVTNDAERVTRSVVLPVCAYLVLLHLYSGKDGVQAILAVTEVVLEVVVLGLEGR